MNKSALLIVDLQNDFCPGGALPVPWGNKIVPIVNDIIAVAANRQMPILASRDWHPQNHCSFKGQGGLWPPHCIQSTWGAELHSDLKLLKSFTIVSKATEPDKDFYSAFGRTDLEKLLHETKTKKLWICGLALDYCVKATAIDAHELGFETMVIQNACAAVNTNPCDGWNAKKEMWHAGINIINFPEFD